MFSGARSAAPVSLRRFTGVLRSLGVSRTVEVQGAVLVLMYPCLPGLQFANSSFFLAFFVVLLYLEKKGLCSNSDLY